MNSLATVHTWAALHKVKARSIPNIMVTNDQPPTAHPDSYKSMLYYLYCSCNTCRITWRSRYNTCTDLCISEPVPTIIIEHSMHRDILQLGTNTLSCCTVVANVIQACSVHPHYNSDYLDIYIYHIYVCLWFNHSWTSSDCHLRARTPLKSIDLIVGGRWAVDIFGGSILCTEIIRIDIHITSLSWQHINTSISWQPSTHLCHDNHQHHDNHHHTTVMTTINTMTTTITPLSWQHINTSISWQRSDNHQHHDNHHHTTVMTTIITPLSWQPPSHHCHDNH